MVIMTVISLLRGSSKETSLLESERCDTIDWFLFVTLLLFCVLIFMLGILIVAQEYQRKVKCGYTFSPGDLKATPDNVGKLCFSSFIGSLLAAFSGVGPGFIFNSTLVKLDVEPQVATSTGMYITLFTTLSASI